MASALQSPIATARLATSLGGLFEINHVISRIVLAAAGKGDQMGL